MVLVLLNFLLKAVLQLLVDFEKHWTQSDKVGSGCSTCFSRQAEGYLHSSTLPTVRGCF